MRRAIGLLVAALFANVAAAQTGSSRFTSRPFTADDGTSLIVTEGTVLVPENRSAKDSKTIELHVVRIARSETPSAKAHVLLAGGPGDSGVNLVMGLARRGGAPIADLLGADVIGIDQRGSGQSKPSLRTERSYGLPLDQPGSPESWLPLIEKACRDVARELTSRGIHLPSYNTRESADDVDAVRRALGYERIVLWGRSYGSHLALAVLRQHPKTIERVILANPEGPGHTFKLPSRVDEVLARLDQRNGAGPGLRGQMRAVLERLERAPVHVDVRNPQTGEMLRVGIGRFDLELLTSHALGDSRLAATLPAAYAEMAGGDFRRIAPLVMASRARMGVESAMKAMMDLSSGATSRRRRQIEREAKDALLGNAINFPLMSLSDAWGNPDLGDEFRRPVRSGVPVLIFAGDLDPRTPVENGREIVQHLPHGHLVVVANATHNFDFFGSPEIRAVLADFLRGEKMQESTRLARSSKGGMTTMNIGVLGTGDVGRALGKAFLTLGHDVKMGARSATNEKALAWVKDMGAKASAGTFADAAAFGEILVLATLGVENENVLKSAGPEHFRGKVLIDATNPLDFSGGMPPKLAVSGNDSGGERVQRLVPEARVVKAFNTVGSPFMFRPDFPGGPPDMFIAGNDEEAKRQVRSILADFGWGVIDTGGIESSRYLEAMCIVWVVSALKANNWSQAFKMLRK